MIDKRNPAKVTNEEERAVINLASNYDIVYECLGCGKIRVSKAAAARCSKTRYCGEEGIEKRFRCRRCGVDYGLLTDARKCDHRVEGYK